jgi:hypothetical protein
VWEHPFASVTSAAPVGAHLESVAIEGQGLAQLVDVQPREI